MIGLLFLVVVCGVLVYLVNNLVPMDGKFKLVFNCIIGLILLYYVLSFFGLVSPAPGFGAYPGYPYRGGPGPYRY
jgi:hypothetical protein